MIELKLEALFCVPFDQMVNPGNLVCCGRESECRFLCADCCLKSLHVDYLNGEHMVIR